MIINCYIPQEFCADVKAHSSDKDSVTTAEEGLFDTELSSIELCEEHLNTSATEDSSFVLPDWLERPGATEAVEVGADLRNRYNQLGLELGARSDEGAQLLEKVLSYEDEYDKLSNWLKNKKEVIQNLSPPAITVGDIRQQLKEVEVCVCMQYCMYMY